MDNHGNVKFAPRENALSSIYYILILEINNYLLLGGDTHTRAHTYTRGPARFCESVKKSYHKEKKRDLALLIQHK